MIVIGIENGGDKRMEELTPFKNLKHGGENADKYFDFLINRLKPHIDKNYRTKTTAKKTCLFGGSLGWIGFILRCVKISQNIRESWLFFTIVLV